MKIYHYLITVLITAWFIFSVIFARNINDLKDSCFIFILALAFIGIGIYLDDYEDKGKPKQQNQ